MDRGLSPNLPSGLDPTNPASSASSRVAASSGRVGFWPAGLVRMVVVLGYGFVG